MKEVTIIFMQASKNYIFNYKSLEELRKQKSMLRKKNNLGPLAAVKKYQITKPTSENQVKVDYTESLP